MSEVARQSSPTGPRTPSFHRSDFRHSTPFWDPGGPGAIYFRRRHLPAQDFPGSGPRTTQILVETGACRSGCDEAQATVLSLCLWDRCFVPFSTWRKKAELSDRRKRGQKLASYSDFGMPRNCSREGERLTPDRAGPLSLVDPHRIPAAVAVYRALASSVL